MFFCQKFSILRKSTSSKVFKALLTHSDVTEDDEALDKIKSILSDTTCEVSLVDNLRPVRNSLCDLLECPPWLVNKKPV